MMRYITDRQAAKKMQHWARQERYCWTMRVLPSGNLFLQLDTPQSQSYFAQGHKRLGELLDDILAQREEE